MITILTVTMNRELYLKRLLDSMTLLSGYSQVPFEHLIIFNGAPPSEKIKKHIYGLPFANNVHIGATSEVFPVGKMVYDSVRRAKYPIFFKLDDDFVLSSMDFLPRVVELCEQSPHGVLFPYLVDGETPMPVNLKSRQTLFLPRSNLFITVGAAPLPSGKYIIPTDMALSIAFHDQDDQNQLFSHALANHLPVFQTTNGLVLENQEGFSGQHHRKEKGYLW